MPVCQCAQLHVCKSANVLNCMYACLPVCSTACMPVCQCAQVHVCLSAMCVFYCMSTQFLSRFISTAEGCLGQKSNWNLPKVHLMAHIVPSIIRGGPTTEYSASFWEGVHRKIVKHPIRESNMKQTVKRVLAYASVQTILRATTNGHKHVVYETASRRVSCLHSRGLPRRHYMNRAYHYSF